MLLQFIFSIKELFGAQFAVILALKIVLPLPFAQLRP